MDGNETVFTQEGDTWIAKEGGYEGHGRDKDEAARALLEAKAGSHSHQVVSDQTIANKLEVSHQMSASVERLVVKQLKNTTPDGMTHVAYYEAEPDMQGYGVNANTARLDLFKKQKQRDDKQKAH